MCSSVEFVGPLPDVAHHVHHAVGAGSLRMRVDGVGSGHRAACLRNGNGRGIPRVAPGKNAAVRALRGQLPLPLMRQALARPLCVGARIFKRDPGHGPIVPARGEVSVLPVAQKVDRVARRVVRGVEELLELRVGDGKLVDVEGGDVSSRVRGSGAASLPRDIAHRHRLLRRLRSQCPAP